jgi:hypothetical protein
VYTHKATGICSILHASSECEAVVCRLRTSLYAIVMHVFRMYGMPKGLVRERATATVTNM